jgi:hypothetical protein
MANELYFLPIIIEALEGPNPKAELLKAFQTIEQLGRETDHKQGYAQFLLFMREIGRQASQDEEDLLSRLAKAMDSTIVELATDTFRGASDEREAALAMIHLRTDWRERYEALRAELTETVENAIPVAVIVEHNGRVLQTLPVVAPPASTLIQGLELGQYTVKLSTGRVLWEGTLLGRHLRWTEAYPGQPLELAADSEDAEAAATLELALLEGDITVRVFPGLETGRMEISVRARDGNHPRKGNP